MYDSPLWDWGKGFCSKHLGKDLPCQKCIETNDYLLMSESDAVNYIRHAAIAKEQHLKALIATKFYWPGLLGHFSLHSFNEES